MTSATKMPFTGIDVLTKARAILAKGALPKSHRDHGNWCPRCALALAKDRLDRKHRIKGSWADWVVPFGGLMADLPLCEAVAACRQAEEKMGVLGLQDEMDRATALAVLDAAISDEKES